MRTQVPNGIAKTMNNLTSRMITKEIAAKMNRTTVSSRATRNPCISSLLEFMAYHCQWDQVSRPKTKSFSLLAKRTA